MDRLVFVCEKNDGIMEKRKEKGRGEGKPRSNLGMRKTSYFGCALFSIWHHAYAEYGAFGTDMPRNTLILLTIERGGAIEFTNLSRNYYFFTKEGRVANQYKLETPATKSTGFAVGVPLFKQKMREINAI